MVYEIVTFDLIGKQLFTYRERPDLTKVEDRFSRTKYVDKEGREAYKSSLWKYSDQLPEGAINEETNKFLPYFADVTEDLPFSATKVGLKPKTYRNCQLLSVKHNGYLEFYHKSTGKTLRIAMNSHMYQPVEKSRKKVSR